ncbi:MAG TPA: DUF3616 domain-containing protein [Trichocoleus sp.]
MESAQLLHQIGLTVDGEEAEMLADLSALRCIDQYLWLGSDEGISVERFTLRGNDAADHQPFSLAEFFDLPSSEDEVDVEGLAYADYYLWITGSHSLKRKKPKPGGSFEDTVERLGTLSCEENRYLIGRIPLVDGQLYRQCPHPKDPKQQLTAAQIKRKKTGNQLTHALAKDLHLGPFIRAAIPGKDNGFDVEGIAVTGDRIFLGLRGPVLRGWAVLLELSPKVTKSGHLKLKTLDGKSCYRKHFLDLGGLGIRDLCWDGDDLLILAGPTMDIAGMARVFRVPDAIATLTEDRCLQPNAILEVPDQEGDKAEGISLLTQDGNGLLVVYDSPGPERLSGTTVKADVFALR